MKIFAIDSSSSTASAALTNNDRPIAVYNLDAKKMNGGLTHSETLQPIIQAVLDISGYKASDIDLFACTIGPGSFTGVRIGTAALKGLAFNLDKPCMGITTTDTLAEALLELDNNAVLCPVLDARRNQLYNALYKNGIKITKERAVSKNDLLNELLSFDCPVYLNGDGYDIMYECINEYNSLYDNIKKIKIMRTPQILKEISAYNTAVLAYKTYNSENKYHDYELQPLYLRGID